MLIAAVLAGVPSAEALTDREKFRKLAQQNGVSPSGAFSEAVKGTKAVCVCHDAGADGRIGFLFMFELQGQVFAACMVPDFTPVGVFAGSSACLPPRTSQTLPGLADWAIAANVADQPASRKTALCPCGDRHRGRLARRQGYRPGAGGSGGSSIAMPAERQWRLVGFALTAHGSEVPRDAVGQPIAYAARHRAPLRGGEGEEAKR